MDIDDFKRFNDSRGHQAGDRLLVAAAAAWQGQLREGDVLCRWGGDEFAALLPDCSEGAAQEIIARVTPTTPGLQSCAAGVAAWDGAEPELSSTSSYRSDHNRPPHGVPKPLEPAESLAFEVSAGSMAGVEARRALLAGNGALPSAVRDEVLLLVTELVTNAVRHANAGPDRAVRPGSQRDLRRSGTQPMAGASS